MKRRRDDDHLSLVAGITSRQRKGLVARELDTVVRLASAPLPLDPPLDGSSSTSIERVREQARIQVEGRGLLWPIYELLLPAPGEPIEPERGLAILPDPDPGDLFLDLEGDPYALDDGVDYLFGRPGRATASSRRSGRSIPRAPADVTLAGERAGFERLMDLLTDRLDRYPDMHVYHYAPYEPTALKRLMGRHATREDEVDRLLRGGVLVDLFRAVRQGLRASVESYSIKKIEPLYGFVRDVPLRDAGSSIVAFEQWLELGEGDRPASAILDDIALYNRDDVRSTLALRDWLETLRIELAAATGQVGAAARRGVAGGSDHHGCLGCPRAGGRRGAHRGRSRRSDRAKRRAAGRSGCSPSCWPGIGARARWRTGSSSAGSGSTMRT